MKFVKLKKDNGFTMMELIITIALMSIVFLVIFGLINFTTNSFLYGTEKLDEQAELRLSAIKVTNEIRNAFKVEVNSGANPTLTKANEMSMYSKPSGGIYIEDSLGNEQLITSEVVKSIRFSIDVDKDKVLLIFVLKGDNLEVDTEVILNNIKTFGPSGIQGNDMIYNGTPVISQAYLWYNNDVADKD